MFAKIHRTCVGLPIYYSIFHQSWYISEFVRLYITLRDEHTVKKREKLTYSVIVAIMYEKCIALIVELAIVAAVPPNIILIVADDLVSQIF